jgi:site-specific DNA-methyltransferase (adenine-specific)
MSDCVELDQGRVRLYCGDCLQVLKTLEANSVDAVVTDPPYFRVKGEAWDRQWDTAEGFIGFIRDLCGRWHRLLRSNGSLYCFASPRMAARVECAIGERFNVLHSLVWNKGDLPTGGRHKNACKESLRSFFPASERIIFAEHYGADNIAKGEAGYGAKCDELRGFVFEPLRAYLDGERERAGVTPRQVNEHTLTQMAGHWFTRVQWALPTAKHYSAIRDLFNAKCNGSGPQYLRREYEDLRREYEDLRRPFQVTADVPYTDVWAFPTVQAYQGKHPCEKPLAMMEHIVNASTRADAVVADCFMGSGTTGVACVKTGRRFIGIELDRGYFDIAVKRITKAIDERDNALFKATA